MATKITTWAEFRDKLKEAILNTNPDLLGKQIEVPDGSIVDFKDNSVIWDWYYKVEAKVNAESNQNFYGAIKLGGN